MNLSEVRIDRSALVENVAALRKLTKPNARIACVVKGNAYGHGLTEVAKALESHADLFQVDDFEELTRLRETSSKKAIVLGYVARHEIVMAMDLNAEFGLFDREQVEWFGICARCSGRIISVHLKVDALLGRLGTLPSELNLLCDALEKWPELKVVGVYAHFANIEDTTDLNHAQAQRDTLDEAAAILLSRGIEGAQHISATSGLLTMEPHAGLDLVRLGIGIYGMYPSPSLARSHRFVGLRPALTWATHLAQVKDLPARHPIGYGLTYVTHERMKIGIVPLGYSDGYDRGLSNSGEVLVVGKRCPVLGRIAMNMFAVDLSAVPDARMEDEVVLIGKQGGDEITAEEVAARIGTINYEITSRISPLLPRVLE